MLGSLLFFLTVASLPAPVSAGNFSVTPVRMYLTPRDRAVAVTLTNEGDTPLVMQADLYLWKQKPGGEDELTLTEDLFLSPPIIKLAPKARQVVRLARVVQTAVPRELTYRMIVREVPEALPQGPNPQIQVALAISLPIFITPPRYKPTVACSAERTAENAMKAVCENTGNAHALITALSFADESGKQLASSNAAGYILPGIKRSFEFKPAEGAIPGGKGKLSITLVDGSNQAFDVTLAGPQRPAQ